jgi:hypothetical protein
MRSGPLSPGSHRRPCRVAAEFNAAGCKTWKEARREETRGGFTGCRQDKLFPAYESVHWNLEVSLPGTSL